MAAPTDIKTGQLLISEPFMYDPHFRRTGVLLCDHGEGGSTGFVLNRPKKEQIGDLIPDLEGFGAPVYYGGPVATDAIQYLHTRGDLLEDSTRVLDGLYWGGNFEKLKFLIQAGMIHRTDIRFYRGYSGWSTGQLDSELKRRDWIVTDAYADYVFKTRPEHLWQEVMRRQGNFFTALSQLPGSQIMN